MDKIDKKIISLLQENARYPLKYLAQKVFLSSPAVSTRIERLEKSGVITGYHATVDPVALGYHITAFINLTLDPKQKDEFYPYVTDCPNVLECNCVTGLYSIMLKVAFPSTMELDTFIGHLQNTATPRRRSCSPRRSRREGFISRRRKKKQMSHRANSRAALILFL